MKASDDLLLSLIYYESTGANVFDIILFHLIFIPLFSKIILKGKIYKHQYFSLLISFIGIIFLITTTCLKLTEKDIVPNILNIFLGIFYSLYIVLIKYMVEKYFIPPLKICLLIGIIAMTMNVIGYTIYSLINDDFSYFSDCFDFSKVENKLLISVYFILYILVSIVSVLTFFLSLFYYFPTIVMITYVISPLFLFIAKATISEVQWIEIILNTIGYLIALFSTLIYNELIILNCCGLNKNTKKFVNKRIYKELEEIKNSEDNLLSKTDDDSLIIYDN